MFITDSDMVAGAATRLLLFSAAFQHASPAAYSDEMQRRIALMASGEAIGVINNLCLTVRNLQDNFPDKTEARDISCGEILFSANPASCDQIVVSGAFPAAGVRPLGIRDALNKFAHLDDRRSSYNISNRRHYLLLAGREAHPRRELRDTPHWAARIDVEHLALGCIEAVRQLRS